jgi:hypothetical protein
MLIELGGKTIDLEIILDGKVVPKITAFLFHRGGNNDPERLIANQNKSFQGSTALGMGFTFDDTNESATPIKEMHRLIEENPKNQEVIFPILVVLKLILALLMNIIVI